MKQEMLDDLADALYSEVLKENPDLKNKNIKAYTAIDIYLLLILYENNKRELFNTLEHTRRYIEYETDALTTDEMRKEFRILLNYYMHKCGYNQDTLSEIIGVSRKTINRYLTGESLPGYLLLKKLSSAFNCSIDDLYFKNVLASKT